MKEQEFKKKIKGFFMKEQEFKKKIKGFFDDWNIEKEGATVTLKKGFYSIYIYPFSRDYICDSMNARNPFCGAFSIEERELLASEAAERIREHKEAAYKEFRERIFKEFNLN